MYLLLHILPAPRRSVSMLHYPYNFPKVSQQLYICHALLLSNFAPYNDDGFISTLIGGIYFSCLLSYINTDIANFITPANTITQMGFSLVLRSSNIHIANIRIMIHFVPNRDISIPFPQKAVIRIWTPAEAIIATTAGRSECNTP